MYVMIKHSETFRRACINSEEQTGKDLLGSTCGQRKSLCSPGGQATPDA